MVNVTILPNFWLYVSIHIPCDGRKPCWNIISNRVFFLSIFYEYFRTDGCVCCSCWDAGAATTRWINAKAQFMPSWCWRNQTTYADTSDLQPPVISFFNHIQSISLACQRRVLCPPQIGNVLYHAATRLFRSAMDCNGQGWLAEAWLWFYCGYSYSTNIAGALVIELVPWRMFPKPSLR